MADPVPVDNHLREGIHFATFRAAHNCAAATNVLCGAQGENQRALWEGRPKTQLHAGQVAQAFC